MIQLLVISDTHGNEYLLRRLLSECRDVDAVLFLGDGLREVEALFAEGGRPPLYAVRGNCDSDLSLYGRAHGEELLLSLGGHRLLLLHGHTVSVKLSEGGLRARARQTGADIVLFGHTHTPIERYDTEAALWLFNPGSLGRPLNGRPSFGRISLDERGGVLFSHGEMEVSG